MVFMSKFDQGLRPDQWTAWQQRCCLHSGLKEQVLEVTLTWLYTQNRLTSWKTCVFFSEPH